ncbi:MAG TPA: hypothetical protein VGG25_08410 [Streptosporangiaceae bacterium]
MAGEEAQDIGESGLQRAMQWLERSTRVGKSWTRHDRPMGELLEFTWPQVPAGDQSAPFSFDLGGTFRGRPIDNQSFLAEVKAYRSEHDLPSQFRDFLAKCYVALEQRPGRCDHFLWVSWSPFQARRWDKHATAGSVRASVLHEANRMRVLGISSEADAALKVSPELLAGVASRVWLLTLCRQQEQLVLTPDHYSEVVKLITAEGRTVA